MVKIRLRRIGAKKQPSYRLVVADSRSPRDGAFIAIIGHYNPLTDPETLVVDEEKASAWLKQGAQPTDTAARLLAKAGIIEEPAARKDKMKAGTPDKPKASKKKAKAAAAAAEEAKAEAPAEAEAEAPAEAEAEATAEEPKAEAPAEAEAPVEAEVEETKAEVTEEPKAEAEVIEPETSAPEAPEAGDKQT
ncbi:MAG: 30S ribosomal protein S16 [Dehalococcoidia bacterium]